MSSNIQHVTDFRSNEGDQTAYAAKKIGRSKFKRLVFKAVYFGKKKIKTVDDIAASTGLKRKRVLEEAKKLVDSGLIHQTKHAGDTAYTRDQAYKGVWKRIFRAAGNKERIAKIPTKTNPQSSQKTLHIRVSASRVQIVQITIDDLSSFQKCKKHLPSPALAKMPESKFKKGILKILGETGTPPKDWGGEKNDIYTTRLKVGTKRFHAAFALKGPGQKVKKLTPRHMGKNGDQIQRLITGGSVQIFLVQYWGQIDQSIVDQMREFAIARSFSEGRKIYFGIIDGPDSSRLIKAYPKAFR